MEHKKIDYKKVPIPNRTGTNRPKTMSKRLYNEYIRNYTGTTPLSFEQYNEAYTSICEWVDTLVNAGQRVFIWNMFSIEIKTKPFHSKTCMMSKDHPDYVFKHAFRLNIDWECRLNWNKLRDDSDYREHLLRMISLRNRKKNIKLTKDMKLQDIKNHITAWVDIPGIDRNAPWFNNDFQYSDQELDML